MTEPKLLGVCAWLADRFELDVSGMLLGWIIVTLLGVGSPGVPHPRINEAKNLVK